MQALHSSPHKKNLSSKFQSS